MATAAALKVLERATGTQVVLQRKGREEHSIYQTAKISQETKLTNTRTCITQEGTLTYRKRTMPTEQAASPKFLSLHQPNVTRQFHTSSPLHTFHLHHLRPDNEPANPANDVIALA
ncbi:hypothetical protein BaRGS_00018807 [Batillaria attramentaria]|uniref:Uncharacterized protein n=1 Tax=Batillaria attramentaria TaxID=370345 RepID=A0ABD0KT42_9CAEN